MKIVERLKIHKDERGKLIEIFKFPKCGQIYFSTTRPGFTRANHYHTKKIERFCVIEGEAEINLRSRSTGQKKKYLVSENKPQIITIPPKWVHNIINTGKKEIKLVIWSSKIFDPKNPDTFTENV